MTYLTQATTFVGGTLLSVGMYNHLNKILPDALQAIPYSYKELPKSVPLVVSIALTFLGFHVAGKLSERLLPPKDDECNLRSVSRTLGQVALGTVFAAAQIAALHFFFDYDLLTEKNLLAASVTEKLGLLPTKLNELFPKYVYFIEKDNKYLAELHMEVITQIRSQFAVLDEPYSTVNPLDCDCDWVDRLNESCVYAIKAIKQMVI